MTGVYPNGHTVKTSKLDALHDQLMEYADRLEETHPYFAKTLKAEISQRKAQLLSEDVAKKAERAHPIAAQANERATGLETLCTELLKG